MRKLLLLTTLTLFSINGIAEEECEDTTPMPKAANSLLNIVSTVCPNRESINNLCVMVGNKVPSTDTNFKFAYQKKIAEASCVLASDSKEIANLKIQKMWNSFESDLVCNSNTFNVQNGNILKLAVSSKFNQFIFEAAKIWKVNLNKVDSSDQRTVLDYVKYELDRSKGTEIEADLKKYYDTLKSAGAKHKIDL